MSEYHSDSFCTRCNDTGVFTAQPLDETNTCSYVFRCTCLSTNYNLRDWQKKRGFPEWESSLRAKYVPCWEDVRPGIDWIIAQFEAKAFKDPIFQRRLGIWGREWFESVWEAYVEEKKKLDSVKTP